MVQSLDIGSAQTGKLDIGAEQSAGAAVIPPPPAPLSTGTIGGIGKIVYEQAAILANAARGTGIDTQGRAVAGIIMPAAWDAASLRWYAGLSNSLQPVYDNAAARVTTKVAAGEVVILPASSVFFAPAIQFESCDSAGAVAVNQTADRLVIVILREVV